MTGGVNPGDQRALYHLVRALNPSSLLEIGTHLGCSTVNLALAARGPTDASNGNAAPIVTCDIADVNDPVRQPWLRYGSKRSPAALLELAGCRALVEFRIADSCDYLRSADRRFDLIFLDGDHSAAAVYRELPLALKALRPNGLVLLHDYYPDGEPLWPDDPGLPGPALAVGRLLAEGAPIRVLPLGELPWPTRSGSRITSLALVVRAEQ
jgi:predicted O-methyltransferase YrrM